MSHHVKKHIEDQFAKSLSLGPTGVVRKVEKSSLKTPREEVSCLMRSEAASVEKDVQYTVQQAEAFDQKAETLLQRAVDTIPHPARKRHARHSWYVGDIDKQPKYEDLLKQIERKLKEEAAKPKQSLIQKAADTKLF